MNRNISYFLMSFRLNYKYSWVYRIHSLCWLLMPYDACKSSFRSLLIVVVEPVFHCQITASFLHSIYYLILFKFLQGIILKTPLQWPLNKGFSFSCWLRVENFPRNGAMGLFSFLTENGRGSLAVLAKEKLTYEVGNKSSEKSVFLFNLCIVP